MKDQIYRHPNCKSRLKIKRVYESGLVTCHCIDEEKQPNIRGEQVYPTIITHTECLTLEN